LTQNGKETEPDRTRGEGEGEKNTNTVQRERERKRERRGKKGERREPEHQRRRDERWGMRFDKIGGIMAHNKAKKEREGAREQVGIKKYHIHKRTAERGRNDKGMK